MPTEIVDAHVHLLPPRLAGRVRAIFDAHLPDQLAYPVDADVVVPELVAAGVTSAWSLPYAHKPGVAAWLNPAMADHVADLRRRHPGIELVTGATVHPGDPDPVADLEAAVDAGARVLKLHCAVGGFRADDRRLDPVWRWCGETRLPVVVHVGKHVAGTSAADDLDEVDAVARRHPQVRLIVAHTAHPAFEAALDLLERHEQVHADLTPVIFEAPPVPDEALTRFADRLLFGSDAPNTACRVEDLAASLARRGLAPTVVEAILGGTARRLQAGIRTGVAVDGA